MSAEGQPTKLSCEKMPAWNLRPADKETDKHLTTVESNLRLLSEVKDRARKYGVSYMAASPYSRWILASLYEMRLTVALLDANGEGALSYFQRHTLNLARMAVRELEEMKREVEGNSGAAVDVWGTMNGRDERAGLAQEAEVSKDKKPPHGSASSASAQAPVAVVEEEHDYAKIKREDQTAAKDRIDGSSKVDGQRNGSPNVKQEGAGSGSQKSSNDDRKGVEPRTLFIGEVNGGIYHFVDTAGEVSFSCRGRKPEDSVNIQQYKLTQLMNALLNHEHTEVRRFARALFPRGITAEVDKDGNYIDDWI